MTKLIQIHSNLDGTCTITSFINADGSPTTVIYPSIEAASKVIPVLAKAISGLPRDADGAQIWFNDDTTVNRIQYQNSSRNKDEAPGFALVKGETLKASDATAVETLKADVLVKTGNPPEVKPIGTPDPDPIP